jgi:hypothetical protein
MLYIELAPGDVWEEFQQVTGKLRREAFRSSTPTLMRRSPSGF